MTTKTRDKKLTLRELPVVPRTLAKCATSSHARIFLMHVIDEDGVELIPLESTEGCVSFATACDGRGYTLTYKVESVGTDELHSRYVRIVDAQLVHDDAYNREPCNYDKYRIRFHETASYRIDPLEFAWLVSKYGIDITAKSDYQPVLFVRASSRSVLLDFMDAVNRAFGPLIFNSVEGAGQLAYEEIDF